MDCIARRTRHRENRDGSMESESRAHLSGGGGGGDGGSGSTGGVRDRVEGLRPRRRLGIDGNGVPASPRSSDVVIVIDDDEEERVGRWECKKEVSLDASVAMRTRSSSRLGKGDSKSPASSDRRAVIVSSESSDSECRGSEASVELRVKSESVSVEEVLSSSGDSVSVGECESRHSDEAEHQDRGGETHEGRPCVARRTRSQLRKETRFFYTSYFKEDESEEEESEEEQEADDESYQETNDAKSDNSEAKKSKIGEECEEVGTCLEHTFKKKRFSGIDILIPGSNENSDAEGPARTIRVAQRTRSHYNSNPIKKNLGTFSSPYQVDVLDLDPSLSSSGEEDDAGDNIPGGDGGDGMDIGGQKEEKGQEGSTEGKSNKRKRVQAPKADSLFKLLVDTILNDPKKLPEGLLDKSSPQDGNLSCHEDLLPLIFSFGDEGGKSITKSDQEIELDDLWANFDFAMEAMNIGTNHTDEGQTGEANVQEEDADPSTPCTKGEHEFILDEQIGIACKFCSYVRQEIQDILPTWATQTGKKSARKIAANGEVSLTLDDLFTQAKNDGDQGPSSHSNGTVWNLIPGIEKTMYQHQREAFEFMWRNLAGGIRLDELKSCASSDGGGCVISHAPGTGKTRLAIVFIQSYMKVFPECRPVIIAPCGMLLTWEKEFKKWDVNLPIHVLNVDEYSGKEDDAIRELVQKEPRSTKWIRLVKLYSWAKGNSILGLSYGLFKRLTDERSNSHLKSAEISKILLEKPGLFVLDEGHTPRNDQSLIWKALKKVKSKQRIILSGTPFQNNLEELYNTLCLVRPKFAEKISPKILKLCQRRAEFLPNNARDIFPERNEGKEKWSSRTNYITDDSLEELRSMINPFVHVYNGKILENLPGLRDCLVVLNPLPQQKCILEKINDTRACATFEKEYKISLAAVHPSLVTSAALSEKEKSLIDEHLLEKLRLNPNEGVKTRFVMELVRLSESLKEKVVVFSQYLQPLSMIRDQLIKQFSWTDGKEVLQMDGKIPSKQRQSSIDIFNNFSSEARVLLASTKACCEGITLTGASRVVLLDIVWNPSVERQAISRAYRIGQEKVVYTYHLITSGTGEEDKYEKQAMKNHLSKLVFSPEIGFNNIKTSSSEADNDRISKLVSEDKILEEMRSHDKHGDIFRKIHYPPKESSITYTFV